MLPSFNEPFDFIHSNKVPQHIRAIYEDNMKGASRMLHFTSQRYGLRSSQAMPMGNFFLDEVILRNIVLNV